MSTGELLNIEPQELQFPFELKKQICCSMQLLNKTDHHVAFKVKTTNPKKYCVRPNSGIVLPRSTCNVIVTMQAQKEAPADMQCRDKFLLQSAVASPGAAPKDITPDLFNKESGNQVEECKLKVNYVAPPRPPSPVREGSEEGSSPRASLSDNGIVDTNSVPRTYAESQEQSSEAKALISKLTEEKDSAIRESKNLHQELVPRTLAESQEQSSEAKALLSKLTEEKDSAIRQSKKLRQELELLRREGNKSSGGILFIYVILIGLLGLLLRYMLK